MLCNEFRCTVWCNLNQVGWRPLIWRPVHSCSCNSPIVQWCNGVIVQWCKSAIIIFHPVHSLCFACLSNVVQCLFVSPSILMRTVGTENSEMQQKMWIRWQLNMRIHSDHLISLQPTSAGFQPVGSVACSRRCTHLNSQSLIILHLILGPNLLLFCTGTWDLKCHRIKYEFWHCNGTLVQSWVRIFKLQDKTKSWGD